ncbi:hypothetical protein D0T84_16235 [Dysgonomonas sp. 521]|uniref:hypothetical protein n=1 Tax=Dysgonomonas sp. 521 TaxID=2302932 RepID=UPI0013CF5F31|nr:hypothetical protein [Dysgonomonas sp. 521]NDV96450.1 hypothetical protein [Dysgonomonas sp. 521]
MKNIATKIGDVEVTPGVAQFLQNMLRYDVNTYVVDGYLKDLSQVQDYLTRILLELEAPEPDTTRLCLGTVMAVRDQLCLLMEDDKEGGEQC